MHELASWLVYAVLHSLLVFWLPFGSFKGDTVWDASKGLMDGIEIRGFVIFCTMTWAMQLSVSLNTLSWTRWNYGLILFSQFVFYIFCLVLASSRIFSADFLGVTTSALSRPAFYFNIMLSCASLTLLDFTFKGIRLAVAPKPCDTARLWALGLGSQAWSSEGRPSNASQAWSSEGRPSNGSGGTSPKNSKAPSVSATKRLTLHAP